MADIYEIDQAKEPVKGDEIFTGLKFEGVDFAFQVSEENTWVGDWVYRIYHLDSIKWKCIEKREYDRIIDILRGAATIHNSGNLIGSELRVNQLMDIWKLHFLER